LEVIGAVGQIRAAVSSMTREASQQEFGYPNKHFAQIGGALSDVYFDDQGIGVCQSSCPPISCGVSEFRGAYFGFGVEPDGSSGLPVAGFA
jgi:hypothetical protein